MDIREVIKMLLFGKMSIMLAEFIFSGILMALNIRYGRL